MASKKSVSLTPRAVRQLRRTRCFYAVGAALWAVGAAGGAAEDPGGRQMWVSLVFLAVFAGLLVLASVWLWRHHTDVQGRTAHHSRQARPAPTARRGSHTEAPAG
ncbi:hypothetical protein ACFYYH_02460 [Streptomyces sp. NPDC002018]|uniref:hypothetical protein n=1 Tax=Streptomyces sp. NPDC002018 TaxID=3364629 RepID=UPI0036874D5F